MSNPILDIKRMNGAIEMLRDQLGDALLACDIWIAGTGQSIGGYNPQPKAVALFDQVSEYINKALQTSEFPAIDKFYMLDCSNDALIFILYVENYYWGMLLNKKKAQLGLVLNVILPQITQELKSAIKSTT